VVILSLSCHNSSIHAVPQVDLLSSLQSHSSTYSEILDDLGLSVSEKDILDTHKSYLRQIASIFRSEPDPHHLTLSSFISTSQLVHDEWKAVDSTISRLIYDRYDAHIASEWLQSLQSSILADSTVDDCVTNLLKANVDITLFAISVLLIGSEAYNLEDALRGVAGGTRSSTHIGNSKSHFHQDAVRGSRAEVFEMIRDKPDLNHHFGRSDDRTLSSFTENLSHSLGSSEIDTVNTSPRRTAANAGFPTIANVSELTEISSPNRPMGSPAPNMTGTDEDRLLWAELNQIKDFAQNHPVEAQKLNGVYDILKASMPTIREAADIMNKLYDAQQEFEALPVDIRKLLYLSAVADTPYDQMLILRDISTLLTASDHLHDILTGQSWFLVRSWLTQLNTAIKAVNGLNKCFDNAMTTAREFNSLDNGNLPQIDLDTLGQWRDAFETYYPAAQELVNVSNHHAIVAVLDGLTILDRGRVEAHITNYVDYNDITRGELANAAIIMQPQFYDNYKDFIAKHGYEINRYLVDIRSFNKTYWKEHDHLQNAFEEWTKILENPEQEVGEFFSSHDISDQDLRKQLEGVDKLFRELKTLNAEIARLNKYTPDEIATAVNTFKTELIKVAGFRDDWPQINKEIGIMYDQMIAYDSELKRVCRNHDSLLEDLKDFSQNRAQIMQHWSMRLRLWIMNSLSGWPRVSRFLFGD
jgi:hypothetical protein